MQVPLVLTLIGPDRPGLVETIAGVVAAHDGNWVESRLCRLGGQFAGIVRVFVPVTQRPALTAALAGVAAQGLKIEAYADETGVDGAGPGQAVVELVGQDRPGIVRQVAAVLAARGVNVEELRTECLSAPMSGEPLFKAQARLRLPEACDVAGLRGDLERIAADLQVDLNFEPLQP